MSDASCIIVMFLVAILSIMGGCYSGTTATSDLWRDNAVKQGHAEYYLDLNNQRGWRWKTNGCKAVAQ